MRRSRRKRNTCISKISHIHTISVSPDKSGNLSITLHLNNDLLLLSDTDNLSTSDLPSSSSNDSNKTCRTPIEEAKSPPGGRRRSQRGHMTCHMTHEVFLKG